MPNIKNNSKKYLFKNKLNIRRKSKIELIKESFLMMIFGLFILGINYLIPKKIILIDSFKKNIIEILNNLIEIFFYSFEILIVLLIFFSLLISIILITGSVNRIIKVFLGKSKKIRIR